MERDPYNEERLRDEVIFLHSLWHQGPPQPPLHHHHHFFHPLYPPLFKKQKANKPPTQNPVQISTTEWPCPPSPPPNSTPWPSFKQTQLPSNAHLQLSSPNLQSSASGNRIHLKFVKEVRKYFKNLQNGSDDDDNDVDMEIEDDSGDGGVGENGGFFGYFLKLFEENEELSTFYEKNNEDGEFGCLVCGGVGVMRRFKNCVALVQHTQSISKTKTMKAHRAFGKVVCEVLGWDVNKLPSIISSITAKKNETLSKLEEGQPQVQERVTNEAGDVGSGDKEADGAEKLPDHCELPVVEIVKDESSIDTKLTENTPGIVQGSIEDSLVYLEAGPGSENVGRDVVVSSVNEKGKEKSSTGDEKLPITDILNVAQNLQSESGVGRCADDQLKETLDGKQENAESASNCLEPRKEEGNGENESEDQKRSDSIKALINESVRKVDKREAPNH
ncbi:hypothetical protein Leryth_010050 [Lithospermum erythrorhizon]|nr:hypothetical protein Leryth_010050 [Lithospermum erythrorhizon]